MDMARIITNRPDSSSQEAAAHGSELRRGLSVSILRPVHCRLWCL